MTKTHSGFTLIELMVVISIIALLSAIALPVYRNLQARSAESACLAETKSYATWVVAALANETILPTPPMAACASSDVATAASISISATPRAPGVRTTTCNMSSAACAINP